MAHEGSRPEPAPRHFVVFVKTVAICSSEKPGLGSGSHHWSR
jgi:hypothetical protein